MRTAPRCAAAAIALAAVALLAPQAGVAQEVAAHGQPKPEFDPETLWNGVKPLQELSAEAVELAVGIQEAIEILDAPEGAAGAKAAAREKLARYRDNRRKALPILDAAMKRPAARQADAEILRKLRETELIDIRWKGTKFVHCLQDIADALGVDFVVHHVVMSFNTIEASFPRSAADGILRQITFGFDCTYYVHDGQIIVLKELSPNERRMQKAIDKDPDWKYWRAPVIKEVEDDL
jgi:hypothetical protein